MDVRVYRNALQKKQRDLLTWRQSPLLQSVLCLQREAFFRQRKLSRLQGKRQQRRKSNNTALRYKPTSSTVEDSQQPNRACEPYGKSQFSIRYQKVGTDHTLTVNPAMIRGEPILSISALKVPLCRQRFLRACPMYLSHTVQTKKKVEKEMQVLSIRGNKNFTVLAVICCMSVGMMLCAMLSQRRSTIKLYEKKLERTVSSIEERNVEEAGATYEVY